MFLLKTCETCACSIGITHRTCRYMQYYTSNWSLLIICAYKSIGFYVFLRSSCWYILWDTWNIYWSHAWQREREKTVVIIWIISIYMLLFAPSTRRNWNLPIYSFTKASRLKAWRHCSQQLALLGWQEIQFTCDNTIYHFFKAHP